VALSVECPYCLSMVHGVTAHSETKCSCGAALLFEWQTNSTRVDAPDLSGTVRVKGYVWSANDDHVPRTRTP